jgi:hypothetical protein
VIYADELDADAVVTFTRDAPDGWKGHTGHIDALLIAEAASFTEAQKPAGPRRQFPLAAARPGGISGSTRLRDQLNRRTTIAS